MTFSTNTFPKRKCSVSLIRPRIGVATPRSLTTTVRVDGWYKQKYGKPKRLRPSRVTIRLLRRKPDRAFQLREEPSHEEEHRPAGILGLSFVEATAEHREFALARCDHVRRGNCGVLRGRVGGPFVVGTIHTIGGDFAQPACASGLRGVFSFAHCHCLRTEPGVRARLRVCSCVQRARRALHDPAAGCAAVDPRVELSSSCDAGHGGAVSRSANRCGNGSNLSYFHRPGLEHGFLFLLVASEHSVRNAGGM